MTKAPFFLLLPLLVLAIACQKSAPEAQDPAGEAAVVASAEAAAPASSEEVAYEPAYPAEVSTERLSEDDVAQQKATHSHGGEERSHDHDGDDHDHDH